MFRFISVLALFLFSIPAAFANGGEVLGDYNIGGGLLLNGTSVDDRTVVDGGAGVMGNAELVALGDLKGKHLVVIEGRFVTFVGPGVQLQGPDGVQPLFMLRLMGNASFGLQAYQVVPLNLSFEDVELKIRGGDVDMRALIGSTIYLPVSMLADMPGTNLYLGLTAGARVNSEAPATAFALQPKFRVIHEDVTAEVRALFTLGSDKVEEQRVHGQLGFNHVFMRGDQVGAIISGGRLEDKTSDRVTTVFEGLLFYGGNL